MSFARYFAIWRGEAFVTLTKIALISFDSNSCSPSLILMLDLFPLVVPPACNVQQIPAYAFPGVVLYLMAISVTAFLIISGFKVCLFIGSWALLGTD